MFRVRHTHSFCRSGAIASLLIATCAAPLFAADWTGAVSNLYSDNANWTSAPSGTAVNINGGANLPVLVDVADFVTTNYLGTGVGQFGSMAITTGAHLQQNFLAVGIDGTGEVTQDAGYLTAATFDLADGGTGMGTYTISGGTLLSLGNAYIGTRGMGTLNISGGDVIFGHPAYVGGTLYIGGVTPDAQAVTSSINQTGGSLHATDYLAGISIGNHSATGVYNLDGGSLNLSVNVANGAGTSYLNINGGTIQYDLPGLSIDVDNLEIGTKPNGAGAYTQTSTDNASLFAGLLTLGSATSSGQMNIEGGMVQVGDLAFGGTTSKILLSPNMSMNVLQDNYSEADALADVSAGYVASAPGGAITVQTVNVNGFNYTQFSSVPVEVSGDYNGDGFVDAADYVIWRKGGSPDPHSQTDYDNWKTDFGAGPGGGSGTLANTASVPEPGSAFIMMIGALSVASVFRRSPLRS